MDCVTITATSAAAPSVSVQAAAPSVSAQFGADAVPALQGSVPDGSSPVVQAGAQPVGLSAVSSAPVLTALHICDDTPLPTPPSEEEDKVVYPFYYGYELVPEDDIIFESNAALVAKIQSLINGGEYEHTTSLTDKGVFVDIPDCGIVFFLAKQDIPVTIGYIDGVGMHQPFQNGRAQVNKGVVTYKGKSFYVYAFAKYSEETVNFIQL